MDAGERLVVVVEVLLLWGTNVHAAELTTA
jgi:hypothetical protein